MENHSHTKQLLCLEYCNFYHGIMQEHCTGRLMATMQLYFLILSHLYLFLVSSSTYLLNDLCISGLIFLSSIWIKYFVILLRRKFLNSTHYLRLTNRLNEFRILCSLCCYDCLSLCKDTQSRKQSQEKRAKIFLEKTIWRMWRGGDITVLPLKNAF